MPQTRAQARKRGRGNEASPPITAKKVRQLADDIPNPLAYHHLDLKSHQIRILHLLPGHRKDPLRCVLRTAFLDDDPKYEALSYVWGDPHDCRSMEVDGRQKNITLNLYHALRRLRYPRRERCLWVDALCINQDNDTEKSHQVNLMKKIYSRTKRAILWLGDFCNGPKTTVNHIPRQTATAAFFLLKSIASDHHYGGVEEDENKEVRDTGFAGLSCLFQLPWWHRAWTVQETVLPTNATIVCGTIQLPFSQLMQAYHNSLYHHFQGCCSRSDDLDSIWNQLYGLMYVQSDFPKDSSSICDTLNMFRARHASDPRDRVYAYVGLGSGISANYALSHEEVFKLTTRSLIEEWGTLESLLRTAEQIRSPTLPTWVPDWCASIEETGHDHELGWYHCYWYFAAAGKTKVKSRPSSSDRVLDLQGFVLDRIVTVGRVMDTSQSMRETITEWQDKPNDEYPLGGTYLEASWRTAMCDVDQDTYKFDGYYSRLRANDEVEKIVDELLTAEDHGKIGSYRKRGFSTDTGKIGIGNRDIRVGDSICILGGGNMPFILRQVEGHAAVYQYIGQAYVHGIMDGEMMDEGQDMEWMSLV